MTPRIVSAALAALILALIIAVSAFGYVALDLDASSLFESTPCYTVDECADRSEDARRP